MLATFGCISSCSCLYFQVESDTAPHFCIVCIMRADNGTSSLAALALRATPPEQLDERQRDSIKDEQRPYNAADGPS